jgi:hypothetical protein
MQTKKNKGKKDAKGENIDEWKNFTFEGRGRMWSFMYTPTVRQLETTLYVR